MSRLQGRLRKLEAVMADDRGPVPHSPCWLAYWTSQLEKLLAGEDLAAHSRWSPWTRFARPETKRAPPSPDRRGCAGSSRQAT
jgi:hypothetical protein